MLIASLAWADYAVIAAFFAAMVAVGAWYARRQTAASFTGADKSVPWWLAGISFYMNSFSALAFVMYSALAYRYGWVPVTVSWLSVPAVLLGARFLAVRWRRAAKKSPIDYISERYTPGMCRTLAWLGLPMQLLDNAMKLLAIGTVVGVGLGFPLFWAICLSGCVIVLYSCLGGLKATLACDFMQFFVVLAVVLVLPVLCLSRCGGFSGFLAGVPEGFFSPVAGRYDWAYMGVFFLVVGSTLSTNWALVQRYYTTRSDREAKKMAYLVAALLFLGPPLFFFPAMAARVFLAPVADAELNGVYALLCREVLPTGLMGLVVAAMFSATMSSLAGNINAAAAVLADTLRRTGVWAVRVATVVVGGAIVALAFVMQYAQGADDLFNLSNKVFGVFLPPIAIPMIAGLFVRRLSRRSGLIGLVGGMAAGLALFALGAAHPALREMKPSFLATSAATVAFLALGSWLFRDGGEDARVVDGFFRRLKGER